MALKFNKALSKLGSVLDPLGKRIHKKAGLTYGDPLNFGSQVDAMTSPPADTTGPAREQAALMELANLRRARVIRRQQMI